MVASVVRWRQRTAWHQYLAKCNTDYLWEEGEQGPFHGPFSPYDINQAVLYLLYGVERPRTTPLRYVDAKGLLSYLLPTCHGRPVCSGSQYP